MREGTRIDDKFEIVEELGSGGMATVFSARQPSLDRLVAIKVFNGGLVGDGPRRFFDEASRHASLNHPNIVKVYDSGKHEGRPYVVMDYVEGKTLARIILDKVYVALAEKLKWMEQLCFAVAYAHSRRIIHRDIKPSNVMVLWNAPDKPVQLLDFGIACFEGSETAVTEAGTASYMSPEQHRGGETLPESDQFALGVVFYELLTNTQAFPGRTSSEIRRRVLEMEPKPLGEMIPDLDKDVIRIVERALQKDPDKRFKDVVTLAQEIARVRRQLDDVAILPPTIPPPSVASRSRTARAFEEDVDERRAPAAARALSPDAEEAKRFGSEWRLALRANVVVLPWTTARWCVSKGTDWARRASIGAGDWWRARSPVVRPVGLRFPGRKLVIGAVVIAGLIVAGLLSGVVPLRRESQPPIPASGTLVVYAVPWATITAIEDENGLSREVPPEASTPFSVNLVPGSYIVVLTGPPPASERRRVRVQAGPGGVATVSEDFGLTAEEYFQQYFGPAEGAPPNAGQESPTDQPKAKVL